MKILPLFTIVALALNLQAETLIGVTHTGNANQLLTFDSSTPDSITATSITGTSDQLLGIDFWGSVLYGVGSGGNLYQINQLGQATLINHFGSLNGLYYGLDVNASGIQIVSDRDINLLLDFYGNLVSSSTLSFNPTITSIGSYNGIMYALDSGANTFGTLNGDAFSVIGSLGTDIGNINGFDISDNGTAYLTAGYGTDALEANLYTVDLATGHASLIGVVGPGDGPLVYGVSTVPEPSTYALAFLGVACLLIFRKRVA